MRKIFIIILIATATCANAQDYSKMSRYIRQLAFNSKDSQSAGAKGISPTLSEDCAEVLAFVKAPEETVSDYCIAHQGDIHICQIPISQLATLSENENVVRIEASENTANADLDSLASCVEIKPLWEGTKPLPQAYDGSGTVIGVTDIGIDYSHPTFRSNKDGRLRIVRAWDMLDFTSSSTYNEKKAFPIGLLLTDTESIENKGYTADSKTEWHGTHTTGIAAGSGWDTPYIGMAPEADIYSVGCIVSSNTSYIPENIKSLSTTTLNALSFQRIFEYADSVGKPAVVSYSISGLQDMTNDDALLNEYLAGLVSTPGRAIVASIGNSGRTHRYLPKTEETDTVGGMVSTSEKLFVINISTKKKLTLRITDYSRTEADGRTKEYSLDFTPTKHISRSGLKWDDYYQDMYIKVLDSLSVGIFSGKDGFDNSRVGYDIFLQQKDKKLNTFKYAVEIFADDTEAEIFVQNGELTSGTSYSPTLTGAQAVGNCGSPAALPAVIGVGSTSYWGLGGQRSSYSSIGPSLHGYTKPDISAPGYRIASAYNSIYRENHSGMTTVKESTYNNKQYAWLRSDGTSMSTPAVAGIIALWLQAKPTLTQEDIIDVFAHTSDHPKEDLTYPNNEYGYGEINAYKGLLYILGIDGIEGLQAEPLAQGIVLPINGGIKIETEGSTPLPCRIYNTGGQLVKTITVDRTANVNLMPGVYAVQVGRLGSTLVRVN